MKHVHVSIHKTIWTLLDPLYGQTWPGQVMADCYLLHWLWPKMILSSWVFENLIANSRSLLLWIHARPVTDSHGWHEATSITLWVPPYDNRWNILSHNSSKYFYQFTISQMFFHFQSGGSAAYLYDDLHSLDNDSFLTSLETISEKDKFNWEWRLKCSIAVIIKNISSVEKYEMQ